MRILGTDLDGTKMLPYGILKIKGISYHFADALVKAAGFNPEMHPSAGVDNQRVSGSVVMDARQMEKQAGVTSLSESSPSQQLHRSLVTRIQL